MISHATEERLKNLLEKLSVIAEHRLDVIKVLTLSAEFSGEYPDQLMKALDTLMKMCAVSFF